MDLFKKEIMMPRSLILTVIYLVLLAQLVGAATLNAVKNDIHNNSDLVNRS